MANKIRMLPDNWTYAEYFQFVTAFNAGRNREAFQLAKKLIVSWDYAVDLNREDAVMRLPVGESAEVLRTVFKTIGNYIEGLDISEVKVNFDAWDTEKFFDFDEWKRAGKFDKTEPMIKEVIKWARFDEVYEEGEPLPFTVAATAYNAISKAYEKVVAGKN